MKSMLPNPCSRTSRVLAPRARLRLGTTARSRCCTPSIVAKMYVPSDSFGGRSPEKQAAMMLRRMFTFISARIILSQLEGSGQGAIASYNQEMYNDLTTFMEKEPINDSEEWIAKLMKRNSTLACRLMEVRSAYVEGEFEWDSLQRLALRDTQEGNKQVMVQQALACLMATPQEGDVRQLQAQQASSAAGDAAGEGGQPESSGKQGRRGWAGREHLSSSNGDEPTGAQGLL